MAHRVQSGSAVTCRIKTARMWRYISVDRDFVFRRGLHRAMKKAFNLLLQTTNLFEPKQKKIFSIFYRQQIYMVLAARIASLMANLNIKLI